MKIKTKLRVGSIVLALVPAVIASSLIGWNALNKAEEALHAEGQAKLILLRESRATQISDYFAMIKDQAIAYSEDRSTIDAITQLTSAFQAMAQDVGANVAQEKEAVKEYYTNIFGPEYAKHNAGERADVAGIYAKLNDSAVPLQYRYILKNPNLVGEKDRMEKSADDSAYSRLHAEYHKSFKTLQERFGYYDIFLIDANTGEVVYSVFKELDFATSLKNGPYADSGLADAYRGAMAAGEGKTYMTDFSPYLPSYQDPAAFMAAPVFDHGKRIGVIAFQLPIDKINAVMTSHGRWKEEGMGESGETYLVGPDYKMRSQSRFWMEAPKDFVAALKTAGIDDTTLKAIQDKQTVIGLQTVTSSGAKKAMDGVTGFEIFDDYRGVPVLSAYKPLEINGRHWAILAEIDEAEAFASAHEMHHETMLLIGGTAAVLTLLSGVLGWVFSRAIICPLERIVASMKDISSGSGDLTVRLDASAKDELGQLAGAFNHFVEKIDGIMQEINGSTAELTTSSEELSAVTLDTRNNVAAQQEDVQQVATAIDQMTVSVKQVAESTQATADSANFAEGQVENGKAIVLKSAAAVRHLADRVQESHRVIEALQKDSDSVGSVLDVIRGVAEQTNLLALNAAIEAARAGEYGRGFAVVASEVRNLAMKTQESTEEIRTIVESLQERSTETVELLKQNSTDIDETAQLSEQTQNAFLSIEEAMGKLMGMTTQIASASEEQAVVTEQIAQNITRISQATGSTAAGAEQTAVSSEMLAQLGDGLFRLVGQFKISGEPIHQEVDRKAIAWNEVQKREVAHKEANHKDVGQMVAA